MKFAVALLVSASAIAAQATPPGPLRLPDFSSLSDKAVNSVNITLNTSLLGIAAGFMDAKDPEEAAVKDLIGGLQGVYVRSYKFDQDFVYPEGDVDAIRKQLSAPGWQQLVAVHSGKDHQHVDVYIAVDQGRATGLAVIASQPREFTIVNIVGSIDLSKFHQLEGKFGIPHVPIGDHEDLSHN